MIKPVSKTVKRADLRIACIRTFSKIDEICICAMLAAAQLRAASLRPTALARPLLMAYSTSSGTVQATNDS